MKKLAMSLDTRNRNLEIYESSNYVNYYQSPNGSDEAVEFPNGAGYIQIASAGDDVWFRIGNSIITLSVPSSDVEDGSSPRFIPANGSVTHRILEETHIALESSDGVVLSYWRQ